MKVIINVVNVIKCISHLSFVRRHQILTQILSETSKGPKRQIHVTPILRFSGKIRVIERQYGVSLPCCKYKQGQFCQQRNIFGINTIFIPNFGTEFPSRYLRWVKPLFEDPPMYFSLLNCLNLDVDVNTVYVCDYVPPC